MKWRRDKPIWVRPACCAQMIMLSRVYTPVVAVGADGQPKYNGDEILDALTLHARYCRP